MKGKCLCGNVSFKLSINELKVYKCFCSLCQKQTGTESNLGTIIPDDKFEFLSGKESITTWVKDSGYTSSFCKCCGSPVPNRLRNRAFYWIPVGLLDVECSGKMVSHIFTDSKRHIRNSESFVEFSDFPVGGIEGHIRKLCGE